MSDKALDEMLLPPAWWTARVEAFRREAYKQGAKDAASAMLDVIPWGALDCIGDPGCKWDEVNAVCQGCLFERIDRGEWPKETPP